MHAVPARKTGPESPSRWQMFYPSVPDPRSRCHIRLVRSMVHAAAPPAEASDPMAPDDQRDRLRLQRRADSFRPASTPLLAQTRPPDEIIVINNASTDETGAVARAVPGVRVVDEPRKGLVRRARDGAAARRRGDMLAYVDADCRAPICVARARRAPFSTRRRAGRGDRPVPVLRLGLARPRADARLRPRWSRRRRTSLVHHVLRHRRDPLRRQLRRAARRARADRRLRPPIEFHGEDTNLGRRLTPLGRVALCRECWVWTSARRYRAMGKRAGVRPVRRATSGRRSCVTVRRDRDASGREGLTCRDTSRFCSATSTSTRGGATAGCRCARSSICTARPAAST